MPSFSLITVPRRVYFKGNPCIHSFVIRSSAKIPHIDFSTRGEPLTNRWLHRVAIVVGRYDSFWPPRSPMEIRLDLPR